MVIKKTTVLEIVEFLLVSVMSGILVGLAAGVNLILISYLEDWGRVIGAVLFSSAIFAIITFGLNLYTGLVSKVLTMKKEEWWHLPVAFIFNAIGIAIIAILLYFGPLKEKVVPVAQSIAEAKLSPDNWYIQVLCSSILCGFLITLSVLAPTYAPKKNLSATIGVIMPIIVFALCGFDHSVANMLYFYLGAPFSWKLVGFISISIVGNAIGGIVMPLVLLVVKKNAQYREKEQQKSENA